MTAAMVDKAFSLTTAFEKLTEEAQEFVIYESIEYQPTATGAAINKISTVSLDAVSPNYEIVVEQCKQLPTFKGSFWLDHVVNILLACARTHWKLNFTSVDELIIAVKGVPILRVMMGQNRIVDSYPAFSSTTLAAWPISTLTTWRRSRRLSLNKRGERGLAPREDFVQNKHAKHKRLLCLFFPKNLVCSG